MKLANRNLLVLTLTLDGDTLKGTLDRPADFSSEHNSIFANMRVVSVATPSLEAKS
jgi:hypothetical protein